MSTIPDQHLHIPLCTSACLREGVANVLASIQSLFISVQAPKPVTDPIAACN